jgi:hypothetical protein
MLCSKHERIRFEGVSRSEQLAVELPFWLQALLLRDVAAVGRMNLAQLRFAHHTLQIRGQMSDRQAPVILSAVTALIVSSPEALESRLMLARLTPPAHFDRCRLHGARFAGKLFHIKSPSHFTPTCNFSRISPSSFSAQQPSCYTTKTIITLARHNWTRPKEIDFYLSAFCFCLPIWRGHFTIRETISG